MTVELIVVRAREPRADGRSVGVCATHRSASSRHFGVGMGRDGSFLSKIVALGGEKCLEDVMIHTCELLATRVDK